MFRMNRIDGLAMCSSQAILRPAILATAGGGMILAALLAVAAGTLSSPCHAEPAPAAPGSPEPAPALLTAAEPDDAPSPAGAADAPAESTDRITLGLDLVSRYAWRGQVYGDAPCFQPWAGIGFAGFALGTWGSFPFVPVASDGAGSTTEVDMSLARSLELPAGTITATVTDYYFPSSGISHFEFAGDGDGAHTIEAGLAYRGPDRLPIGLCGSANVHNDPDHAAYLEASFPLKAGSGEVSLAAGAALGKSAWYAVANGGVHVINAAVTFSRPLTISETFAPTLKVSWILNPYKESTILVAAISL
jgi:hypothetical protein